MEARLTKERSIKSEKHKHTQKVSQHEVKMLL